MDKKKRKRIYQALVAAQPYLWNGYGEKPYDKEIGICACVYEAYLQTKTSAKALYEAEDMIGDRVGYGQFVTTWLLNHNVDILTAKGKHDWPAIQAYRKRWLETMIEEFSK